MAPNHIIYYLGTEPYYLLFIYYLIHKERPKQVSSEVGENADNVINQLYNTSTNRSHNLLHHL